MNNDNHRPGDSGATAVLEPAAKAEVETPAIETPKTETSQSPSPQYPPTPAAEGAFGETPYYPPPGAQGVTPPVRPIYPYAPPSTARPAPRGISPGGVIAILVGLVVLVGLGIALMLYLTFSGPISIGNLTIGEVQTETQSVQAGGATSANVNVTMGAGSLQMSGGATDLMNATFTYNIPSLKPQVNYSVSGTTGDLTVQEPEAATSGNYRYEWDVRLNNSIPTDLVVNMGAGTSNVNLAGLNLTGLNVRSGAGQTTIDLSGVQKRNLNVTITGGVGQTTVRLPSDIGVKVIAQAGGLSAVNATNLNANGNTYTNDAYGKSDTTMNVTVNVGVGQLNLEGTK